MLTHPIYAPTSFTSPLTLSYSRVPRALTPIPTSTLPIPIHPFLPSHRSQALSLLVISAFLVPSRPFLHPHIHMSHALKPFPALTSLTGRAVVPEDPPRHGLDQQNHCHDSSSAHEDEPLPHRHQPWWVCMCTSSGVVNAAHLMLGCQCAHAELWMITSCWVVNAQC